MPLTTSSGNYAKLGDGLKKSEDRLSCASVDTEAWQAIARD